MLSGYDFEGTDRFQVLRRLGGGGMGVVYEAFDRDRNARVALKTLKTADATAVLRFKNEFRWLQDLQHPNLVSFHELFAESGLWFFTMELVDGVDFLAWVRQVPAEVPTLEEAPAEDPTTNEGVARTLTPGEGRALYRSMLPGEAPPANRFDEQRLRGALAGLARGVAALHAAQKIHRDIKPSNIIVTPAGRAVLLDFGLAKHTGHQAGGSDAHVVGTVDYMAPEQAASKPVGPEADWYSVGTILYEALTGRVPFSGAPLEVLMAKQTQLPVPPRTSNPAAPRDLDLLCMELLRPDPRTRPAGAEVLRRLGVEDAVEVKGPPSSSAGAPFVGRHQELHGLQQAFGDTRGGQPVTVYVQGESGVGKSALVRRFVDHLALAHPGAVVLTGRCYERETVPYKAFDGIVDALSRYMMKLPKADAAALLPLRAALLAQVFPVLRRVEAVAQSPLHRNEVPSPQELRQRVFAALRELLCRLAERHPLVLIVDDLQWADGDSLALLGEVMRPPDAPGLLLVGTVRVASDSNSSGRGGSLNLASIITGDVRHVQVPRLPPAEARELVALLLGKGNLSAVRTIAEEAAGHPLFIDELVRHASSGAKEESGPTGTAKLRLDEALWARVSRLEPSVRQLLELVVVAGAPLVQETASAAAAIDFAEFGKRAAMLRVANLVRTGGARRTDNIEPYHDRVREAVVQHLDPRTRKRCHERLALALEAAGRADPEALSVHWRGAGDTERSAHYSVIAAKEAAEALAFDRSARFYRLAIELRPIEGPQFQAALGAVLAAAGRGAEAALAYLEAAKGASLAESLELQRKAAEQLLISGHVDAGLQALARVLETFKMKLPKDANGAVRSLLVQRIKLKLRGLGYKEKDASQISPATLSKIDACWSVGVGLGLVDQLRGADYQARHLLLALEAGEPYRVARGLASEALYYASVDKPARAEQILKRVDEISTRIQQPHAAALGAMAGGMGAYLAGNWREGRTRLEIAETLLRERCHGVAWELDTTQLLHIGALYFLGDIRELIERMPLLYRSASERGDLFAKTNLRTNLHAYWLLRDDPDRARGESSAAIRKWSRGGFHTQHYYDLMAQVNSALYLGEAEKAWNTLLKRWPALVASQQLRVQLVRAQTLELRARVLIARAHAQPESRDKQLAEVADLARRLERENRGYTTAYAHQLRAGIAIVRGDRQTAAAELEHTITAFEGADMRLYAQLARRARGLLQGDTASVASIDSWMTGERIKNPTRLTMLILPGFVDEP